jgi:hypothetical protein
MSSSLAGVSDEILIKKRHGIYGNFKYLYWRIFVFLLQIKKKLIR